VGFPICAAEADEDGCVLARCGAAESISAALQGRREMTVACKPLAAGSFPGEVCTEISLTRSTALR